MRSDAYSVWLDWRADLLWHDNVQQKYRKLICLWLDAAKFPLEILKSNVPAHNTDNTTQTQPRHNTTQTQHRHNTTQTQHNTDTTQTQHNTDTTQHNTTQTQHICEFWQVFWKIRHVFTILNFWHLFCFFLLPLFLFECFFFQNSI